MTEALSKAPKKIFEHKDKLGRKILPTSYVVAPFGTRDLRICTIQSISEKMIRVSTVGNKNRWQSTSLKYPDDLLVIDDKEVTFWILKNSS